MKGSTTGTTSSSPAPSPRSPVVLEYAAPLLARQEGALVDWRAARRSRGRAERRRASSREELGLEARGGNACGGAE